LELGEDTTLVQPEGLDLLKQFEMFVSIKIKNLNLDNYLGTSLLKLKS